MDHRGTGLSWAAVALPHDDTAGSGPAVLLLHAGVADRRMWRFQGTALADAGQRAIAPDLRGFGESPIGAEQFSHVDDLVELLDELGIERAAVVGASYGGYVAQELAGRHPDRVAALTLLCPAAELLEPDATLRRFGADEEAMLAADDLDGAAELNVATWVGPEAGDEVRDLVRRMQLRAFGLQADAPEAERDDGSVDPAQIQARTLVVSGRHDLAPFQDAARRLAQVIPHARHLELPWAGHLPSLERPDETTALLLDFLTATPPG